MTFSLKYDKNHTKIKKIIPFEILKTLLKALLSSCLPAVRYDGYSCLNREPQGVACGFRLRGAPAGGRAGTDEKKSAGCHSSKSSSRSSWAGAHSVKISAMISSFVPRTEQPSLA